MDKRLIKCLIKVMLGKTENNINKESSIRFRFLDDPTKKVERKGKFSAQIL